MKPNLPACELTSDYEAFCDRLSCVNFQPVIDILQQRLNWTKQQIDQGLQRYQQLLFLVNQYPNQPIVPDQIIDEVVHAHLETGDQFVKDCQHILGFELVHEAKPKLEEEGDRGHWLAFFEATQTLLNQIFKSNISHSLSSDSSTLSDPAGPAHCVLKSIRKAEHLYEDQLSYVCLS